MTSNKTGLKRNTIDKFYTKTNVVKICMKLIKKKIKIGDNDLVVEPSAGNGSFIEPIKSIADNYKFYDIDPEHDEIKQKDYLKLKSDKLKRNYDKIHVIGNPPFGRQSTLAIKFIKKSCEYTDTVSFILPKSFKKESMQKHFPLKFHLIYEIDLPENSFQNDGIDCDVPCVFQIWKRKATDRKIEQKLTPKGFSFVKKDESPDISFRRVGVNAGTISIDIDEKSEQSHYFIKFTNGKKIKTNLMKLKNLSFDFNNTVGPKSISKQELIKQFNELL